MNLEFGKFSKKDSSPGDSQIYQKQSPPGKIQVISRKLSNQEKTFFPEIQNKPMNDSLWSNSSKNKSKIRNSSHKKERIPLNLSKSKDLMNVPIKVLFV